MGSVEAEVAILWRTWLEACRDSLGCIIISAVNSDVVKPEKGVVTVVCRICDFGPLFNALYMISHTVCFILWQEQFLNTWYHSNESTN